jgi:hypothetical protein
MFTTVRLFLKTGIGFLALGLVLGGVLLVRRELYGLWPEPYLVSAHVHAVGVGFILFMILGVALWLFPRAPAGDTRYSPRRITASYWILSTATLARFLGEAGQAWSRGGWLAWVVVLGGAGQILGLGLYFHSMWPRIRSVGSHLRERAGERF